MGLFLDVPGREPFALTHLLLDANGTLTDRKELVDGLGERLAAVRAELEVLILSADTFGTLDAVAATLAVRAERVATGVDKAKIVAAIGPDRCAAIGNGANDAAMLEAAALGIVVVGPEGAAGSAVRAADVVCASILDALDLLLDPQALVATLRC